MSKNNTSGGLGLVEVLLVNFIVLKCCDLVDWSWWWVISPLWIALAFCVVAAALSD